MLTLSSDSPEVGLKYRGTYGTGDNNTLHFIQLIVFSLRQFLGGGGGVGRMFTFIVMPTPDCKNAAWPSENLVDQW